MNSKSLHVRVIAVGDVHGEYEKFCHILLHAKLTDLARNWTGGDANLVQTGDMIDREPKSFQSVSLIRSLQEEAQKAGGRVIAAFDPTAARKVLGLPKAVEPVAFTPLGYPDDSPSGKKRKPLTELVRYGRW